MALDLTKMQATFTNLIAQIPVTCAFGATPFTATKTELSSERLMREYGGADGYELSVLVAANALATFPKAQEKITVDGTVYRVMGVGTFPGGISKRIDLEAPYQ